MRASRLIHRILLLVLGASAFVFSAGPIVWLLRDQSFDPLRSMVLAGSNFLAWTGLMMLLFARKNSTEALERAASQMGIRTKSFSTSLEKTVRVVVAELQRRHGALAGALPERKINSRQELSRALERIVSQAHKLLQADSAEITLFDKDSGLYHSSFVVGHPFRISAQAMLDGVVDPISPSAPAPDILIQPIAFAGSILGTLRIGLRAGVRPSEADKEILNLLSVQGCLAIINAEYTQELLKMRRVSEESVKAKTGFLANLSHELRGPLGLMLNAVDLVLDGLCGEVSGDQEETLKMVRSNGQHLLELINDVLDYAKIESGKLTPQKVQVVVHELLKDLVGVVRGQAEAKGHKLVLKPTDEFLTIQCDRRHFRQMLINMLTNAIKYTPNGGTIEVWGDRVKGNRVKISVQDSGVGISESDRPKVFAAFERIEHSYSMSQMGTGLGMSLTKRLVEVNGGSIDFSSKPTAGSLFWVSFPSVEYNPLEQEEQRVERVTVRGNEDVILLIERDDSERAMITRYFEHLGFSLSHAGSLPTALVKAAEVQPLLVLADNAVLDNDEASFVEKLRSITSPNVPVVLMSSRAFVFDVEKYLRIGVDRCLSKPLDLREVALICRELIDQSKGKKKAVVAPNNSIKSSVINRTKLPDGFLH